MGSLTLRNIDDTLKAKLRLSAAENGVSMEEEARKILRLYLLEQRGSAGIGSRISRRFAAAGGVNLPDTRRSQPRKPPAFSEDVRP
jgi:plasmid stability protein